MIYVIYTLKNGMVLADLSVAALKKEIAVAKKEELEKSNPSFTYQIHSYPLTEQL